MTPEPDVTVVGGGLVGCALALGLARAGARVAVLDEDDRAARASRGNFALVWLQSKGLGLGEYSAWTKASIERWPEFAELLAELTGIDVAYDRPGGFMICLSDQELETRTDMMRRLQAQPGVDPYPTETLDHAGTKRLLPELGPEVAGSIYCPLDGHVNSLRLYRALHAALERSGVDYRPGCPVEKLERRDGAFLARGRWGDLASGKLVLAAGLSNARLAPMVGLVAPVAPSKGQILVTEKARPFLRYPVSTIRQTDEGGVMLGDSQEDLGLDTRVTTPVLSVMAERAVRTFPLLAGLNVVRTWSASRVMSPDGFPIYDESSACPGAFVITCHSGVTLAAAHALRLAPHIAAGALPAETAPFHARRFDVPAAA
jgi:glycine/D-amino acid oxidase-like deaminating enzyme